MWQNGIKFTRVPPYHPASNGAAERSVHTVKVALTKQVLDGKASTLTVEHRLANFLILNRSTPHTVTGQSPAVLFLGWQIRNCFTLLKPSLNRAVEEKQVKQKEYHDEWRVKLREFKLNELVLVRNWQGGIEKCIPRLISQVKGPRTYLARCGNQIRFVHADHLKGTGGNPSWGSVTGSRKSSRAEELVESQAAEEDCLVLLEPLPSEFSTPSPENSAVADRTEEQLVPKETQDSVYNIESCRYSAETSTPGLPLSSPSVPRYFRRERKTTSRLICVI